ncbi:unnamed protein product [Gongylonema pulchrum]|uniref:PDEase domain-containing protein n=1 Tax=Gongylonema pulchrum TaxID=637853 RepID=A0A183ELF8_9BILA|nr:unnamed protein product [Gongylonema pulchrum]
MVIAAAVNEISPHIEWVPIVQRNFTDIINEALHEDYEEKASYQNMERDAKAGKEKILRLEEQQRQRPTASSEPVSTAAAQFITFTLPNLLLFFFMHSLCR